MRIPFAFYFQDHLKTHGYYCEFGTWRKTSTSSTHSYHHYFGALTEDDSLELEQIVEEYLRRKEVKTE